MIYIDISQRQWPETPRGFLFPNAEINQPVMQSNNLLLLYRDRSSVDDILSHWCETGCQQDNACQTDVTPSEIVSIDRTSGRPTAHKVLAKNNISNTP